MADYITGNFYLTQAQMETNARYIFTYLSLRGWSDNAIAGMLGNFEAESTINPGIWEGLNLMEGPGFGLVQWTPYTKYTDWCFERDLLPDQMDSALARIEYELENGLQYIPTDSYPETFAEFKVSTKPPYYLGMAFVHNYERPAEVSTVRGTNAEKWYTFITGLPATGGSVTPDKKSKGLPLYMMYLTTRRRV